MNAGLVWSTSNLATGLICVILVFIILRNSTKKIHYFLVLFNIAVAIWGFGAFFLGLARDSTEAALAWKIACIGGVSSPMIFYHIVNILSGSVKWKIVTVFYIYGILINATLWTGIFDLKVIRIYDSLYYMYSPNVIWKMFIGIWIAIIIYSLLELFKLLKSSFGSEKLQYKYLMIGFVLGFSAAIWDSLPTIGLNVYPASNIFMSLYAMLITYAILRHQLLDIEVIVKKTLIFGGLFTIVYAVFAFFALLGQMFFERLVTQNRWVSMIPSVLVVTVMLRPLENFLVSITDKYLFQKKYDYKKLLKTFTSEVLTVLELDKLIELTGDKLTEIMKIKSCDVVFEIASSASRPRNDEGTSRPRNDGEGMRTRNDETGFKLPITMKNETIGTLVLGRKKSDEDYTQEDLDILQPLTKTLGIAISNAKLFNELIRTRAEVAQKDKMATIGTLAAGMAHEIRNPITTIRNFADYLPDKYNDREFVNKFDKLIPREIDRIESIARSLLEFSSAEDAERREEIALEEPIRTVISIIEPQHRTSEIKIICNTKDRHFVKGNRIQLQDAFFNMLNYILAESDMGSNIFIECVEGKEGLSLSIRNKGLFVAEHIIKDVFEPVSGLYKEKRGFGFNLFVAKQLLERNDGVLTISSDKVNGSEFRIDFKQNLKVSQINL